MTNEEARRILLSDSDFSGIGEKAKLTADALCIAVEALEKQIAKQVEVYSDGDADGYPVLEEHCPSCGYDFDGTTPNFCPDCGQRLLFEEESE